MNTKYTLIPPEIMATIPPLYSTEGTPLKEKTIMVKLFCASFTWYIAEGSYDEDAEDYLMFCYVRNEAQPAFSEWGYTSLNELEELTLKRQLIKRKRLITYVERDIYSEMGKPITEYVDLDEDKRYC